MNTYVWGPLAWRVLHGTAALAPQCNAQWRDVIAALRHCLPCARCRESFQTFTRALPREHINMPRWWHELHHRVNTKLEAQGVSRSQLTFAQLQLRTHMQQPLFSTSDLLHWLAVMAANNVRPSPHASPRRHAALQSLITSLCGLLVPALAPASELHAFIVELHAASPARWSVDALAAAYAHSRQQHRHAAAFARMLHEQVAAAVVP